MPVEYLLWLQELDVLSELQVAAVLRVRHQMDLRAGFNLFDEDDSFQLTNSEKRCFSVCAT